MSTTLDADFVADARVLILDVRVTPDDCEVPREDVLRLADAAERALDLLEGRTV